MQHEFDDRAMLVQALEAKHAREVELMFKGSLTDDEKQEFHDVLAEAEVLHDRLESMK